MVLLGAENWLIENGEQPPSALLLQARAPALHLNLFYAPLYAPRNNYEELLEGQADCGTGQSGRTQIPPAPL